MNDQPQFHPLPTRLYREDGTPTDDVAEAHTFIYVDEEGSHEHPWPSPDANPAVTETSEDI